MLKILFLCTGNYYRSRFAEILFNHHARNGGIAWCADSRALALERGILNSGSLSVYARERLSALSVPRDASWERMPQAVVDADFEQFDRVIALDEDEHRPLMHERHGKREYAVEYWQVHDLAFTDPGEALLDIEQRIHVLINTMHAKAVDRQPPFPLPYWNQHQPNSPE